ncbi:hypothetical protein WMY93_020807 [Mugilogobius chulae]|uniref:N-alpha-acetyltransferase 25, NatB auxiliary subunit n=1 Tax=Mugilogobius chulae TaxID=88201 RepID=A0AAW0NDT4_9GOBI
MQAISAEDEKLALTMFLPLAERMVEKMVKEEKIEAEAEVQLYYMILERLGKCEEALKVIKGPLGEKLTSEFHSRENKCLKLYQRLQRWPECNALAHKLLLKNPDEWQCYGFYFNSLFHILDQSWCPPEEGEQYVLIKRSLLRGPVHHTVAEVARFVEGRIESEDSKESHALRGPYLARLELIHRLRERGSSDESLLGDPLELMVQFFAKFGDKPCCITDLKIYLHLLSSEQHVQFINRLSEAVPLAEPGEEYAFPVDTKALQRHLCLCQLSRALGLHHSLDVDGKLKLISELKARYHHGLIFGKNALKTELQFSDMYCLMAAHVYIDLWLETEDENMVWCCLGLLQEGLSHSSSNAQFKLLLLLLYCRLGAFEPVVDLYSSLDAKHVQHDTIGFLLTRYAESLGQFAAASQACNFSLRFFHSNQKDTSEYIIQAYKYGAFEKIPEFIALRNSVLSLEDSVKAMSLTVEEDDIPWNNLRDNRDLTVFTCWDPKDRQLSEENRHQSLEEESVWLKMRSLTLRLIASFSKPWAHTSTHNSALASETMYPLLGPPSTRLSAALSCGSCQCQSAAFQLAVHLQDLESVGLEESTELQAQICNGFQSLTVQLQEMLNKCFGLAQKRDW